MSSKANTANTNKKTQEPQPLNGYLCDPSWSTPVMVIECKKEARPGYSDIPGHEYNEANEGVLLVSTYLLAACDLDMRGLSTN